MSTFKFHSQTNENVPWQAQYQFPSQQTKVSKHVVKFPPKNGGTFNATNRIRIEFPSDNYMNALNSVLQFDLSVLTATGGINTPEVLGAASAAGATTVTLGASASTVVNAYLGFTIVVQQSDGSKDNYTIIGYPATTKVATLDRALQGAVTTATLYSIAPPVRLQQGGAHNLIKRLRIMYGAMVLEDIQEYKTLTRLLTEAGVSTDYMATSGTIMDGMHKGRFVDDGDVSTSTLPVGYSQSQQPRTYVLNLNSGLLSCKKLIPLKWMASALAIELTLAENADAFLVPATASSTLAPQMQLTNVNFIAELVEFDSLYDSSFYAGLQGQGIPLRFASWHYHNFSVSSSTSQVQIHERSRSVKMALAVMRDNAGSYSFKNDSDRFYHDLGATLVDGVVTNPGTGAINEYWWRIGGMYYPSQPVRCNYGGAEAYAEAQKCFDSLGDYTRGSNIDIYNWSCDSTDSSNPGQLGGKGDKFFISGCFENTDVDPEGINGINAEEQSDLSLSIKASGGATIAKRLDVFVAYDCLMIIRDNSVVELVL